jgi:nicotinate-nucleotide adenylyltransferase
MRLGLFGGSFDPVHLGHLLLAETCREVGRLDQVWFVPAAISPHKQGQPTAPARDRLQMLRLAIGGHPAFEVCDLEIARGGVSYTVDTLEIVRQQHPQAELFFLMGADALADFPNWRQPARICQLAIPMVVHRPQSPPPDWSPLAQWVSPDVLQQVRQAQVEMPLIDVSSRDIRQRVSQGRSIRFRTPRGVETYIETHRLYRTASQ